MGSIGLFRIREHWEKGKKQKDQVSGSKTGNELVYGG